MDPHARPIPDEILAHYLQQASRADAALHEPLYAAQISWTRNALRLADKTLEQEGASEEVRTRVASAVVHGGLDEEEAIRRLEALSAQAQASWADLSRAGRPAVKKGNGRTP